VIELISRAVPNEHARAAALSADGSRTVVARSNGRVAVYEGTQLRFFRAADSGVAAVAISADGRTVASASYTGRILLWDLERDDVWEHVVPGTCEVALCLSADGRRCLAACRGGREVRAERDGLVHLKFEPEKMSTCLEIIDRSVHRSIEFAGAAERIAITSESTARLEIQVDDPWSHQVEEWTFAGDGVVRAALAGVTELPGPPKVVAGKALSSATAAGDVFVRTGDGMEGLASTADPTVRVLASPVFSQGVTKATTKGVVTIAVETPWTGAKHRHTLKCTTSGVAIDAGFPRVRFVAGERLLLDYLALPAGEYIARNATGWYASPQAFDAGFLCDGGRALSSHEAAAIALGAPDPGVLAPFKHAVTAPKSKATKP